MLRHSLSLLPGTASPGSSRRLSQPRLGPSPASPQGSQPPAPAPFPPFRPEHGKPLPGRGEQSRDVAQQLSREGSLGPEQGTGDTGTSSTSCGICAIHPKPLGAAPQSPQGFRALPAALFPATLSCRGRPRSRALEEEALDSPPLPSKTQAPHKNQPFLGLFAFSSRCLFWLRVTQMKRKMGVGKQLPFTTAPLRALPWLGATGERLRATRGDSGASRDGGGQAPAPPG